MNIILLETHEVAGHLVRLEGRRAEHVVKVLRAQSGDLVKIGIINGKIGHGTIKEIDRRQPCSVTMAIDLSEDPPTEPEIDVLLALPRPIMFKRILGQLAALGIGRLYIVNAGRVEKSFWDASILTEQGWRDYVLAGLEQAVDTRLPDLTTHRGFKPFIEQQLPQINLRYRQLLLAHPGADSYLETVFRPGPGRVLLAVGPEGGWSDYEVRSLEQAGFAAFTMGPRILRVETAVTALHAMLSQLMRREAGPDRPPA